MINSVRLCNEWHSKVMSTTLEKQFKRWHRKELFFDLWLQSPLNMDEQKVTKEAEEDEEEEVAICINISSESNRHE